MHNFVENNEQWCQDVAQFVLGRKGISWKRFKNTWLADAFPLDEIGIMFFARCFKRHVCILFNTHFWTTHKDNDPKQCSIFLAYRGNMVYEDTVPMTKEEYKRSAEAIGRIQAKFDENKLKEQFEQQHLRRSTRKRNIIESDEDLDLESLLENDHENSPAKKPKMDNNLQKHNVKGCSVCLQSLDVILKNELNKKIVIANKSIENVSSVLRKKLNIQPLQNQSEPVPQQKNMQKSATSDITWNKFKKQILNKMRKCVSSAAKTSKQCVLKAKQLKKDSWHSVTH